MAHKSAAAPTATLPAMPTTTSERELGARLKLALRSYRKAQARFAACPTPAHAAKVAGRQAELASLLEAARGGMSAAA